MSRGDFSWSMKSLSVGQRNRNIYSHRTLFNGIAPTIMVVTTGCVTPLQMAHLLAYSRSEGPRLEVRISHRVSDVQNRG